MTNNEVVKHVLFEICTITVKVWEDKVNLYKDVSCYRPFKKLLCWMEARRAFYVSRSARENYFKHKEGRL